MRQNVCRLRNGATKSGLSLVFGLSLALALCGCGNGGSNAAQSTVDSTPSRTSSSAPTTVQETPESTADRIEPGEIVIVTWLTDDPEYELGIYSASDGDLLEYLAAADSYLLGEYNTNAGLVSFTPCADEDSYGMHFTEYCGTAVFDDGREVPAEVSIANREMRFAAAVPPPPTDFSAPPPTAVLYPAYDHSGTLWWLESMPNTAGIAAVNERGDTVRLDVGAGSVIDFKFDRAGEGYLNVDTTGYGDYSSVYLNGLEITQDEGLPMPTTIQHVDEIVPQTQFDLTPGVYQFGGNQVAFLGIPPGLSQSDSSLFVVSESGGEPTLLAEGINAEGVLYFGPYR